MVKAQETIDLNSVKPLHDIADNTNQHFWFNETGVDTGAHITEVPQEEWEDSTSPNYHKGGNLLARSNGIAVRDGMTELARFGADGMQVGKDDEKHIAITSDAFNVHDEDGSLPFSVSTRGSKTTRQIGAGIALQGTNGTYHTYTTYIYLRGTLVDNRVYFGVNASAFPTDYSNYITLPSDPQSFPTAVQEITVNGVKCKACWQSDSVVRVAYDNTTATRLNVAYRYTDSYYETSIKVNDATLNNRFSMALLRNVTGTAADNMCVAEIYGHVIQVSLSVYNGSAISSGGLIYEGYLMDFAPDIATRLYGIHATNQVVTGQISSDGNVRIYNSSPGSISSSASSPVTVGGTYIFKY